MSLQTAALAILTMVAFAANSVFCRLALHDPANDPLSFTLVRLAAGAIVLAIPFFKSRKTEAGLFSAKLALAPVMLFSYALFFSLSYVHMSAGSGALILFACVQLTMIAAAVIKGQELSAREWAGFAIAAGGLIYLLIPGLDMPPLNSSLLMAVAGISWGLYSLLGKEFKNPVFATSRNFVFTFPIAVVLLLLTPPHLSGRGYFWATLSGSVTSALGYVLWYKVLKILSTTSAAIIQLSVPAIAAFGGVLFIGETIHLRLLISSVLIFSGIVLKLSGAKPS